MKTTFLLDDMRTLNVDVTCRNAASAYKILEHSKFDIYYFDHDLGDTEPGTSGYDVLKWALDLQLIPEGAFVHLVTSNPVGRQNMTNQLLDHGFIRKGSYFYRRR